MSTEELKAKFEIPEEHQIIQTKTTWKQRSGLDTDTYWYDEVNAAGEKVGSYVTTDSTSMYPPFGRTVMHEKTS